MLFLFNMRNKFFAYFGFLLASLICSLSVHAQNAAQGVFSDNSTLRVDAGTVQLNFSEYLYFGPNTNWEINGTVEIWSKYIWIAPTAKFTGTGKIIIHDPSTNPYYDNTPSSATYIDGNNALGIQVNIELRNPNNLILSEIANPGYENMAAASSHALQLQKQFDFAVDGAHVILNGNDFHLGPDASLVNFGPKRMVVTENSIKGHLIKELAARATFIFPVGIAEEDYTPATLSPDRASTLYVSVQDFDASSAQVANEEIGMNRIWHIFGNNEVNTKFTLQHNRLTNGLAYIDPKAQIFQYAGGANWIGDITTFDKEGEHGRRLLTSGARDAYSSYLTKLAQSGPQAVNDQASVETNASVTINILENDITGSFPILVDRIRIVTYPTHGKVEVQTNGTVIYTADASYTGLDYFEYEIVDEAGNTSIARVDIDIIARGLLIPNVITPNGDGKNDNFVIVGREGFELVSLTIINRWGNEVYKNSNYKDEWNGGNLNDGTYYYLIETKKNNETKVYKGWVLIKRSN